MLSAKLIFVLAIVGSKLIAINGQFGFGRPFFGNSGGSQGGFSNQNTNFQQHRGGSFGVIAGFGTGGSSTSFSNQNNGAGFSNFGNSFGGFRSADENADQNIDNPKLRYASPYDEPEYQPPKPKYVAPPPSPAPYHPAPYHPAPVYHPAAPAVTCPHQLLVSCAPQVQQVPCQPPPPPPSNY